MQIGMIGLGRMGASMTKRLLRGGHACVVHDSHAEAMSPLKVLGAHSTSSLKALVAALAPPRAVWLMVPAAAVDDLLALLVPLLERGDIVVDGGNSHYHDDLRRASALREAGIEIPFPQRDVHLRSVAAEAAEALRPTPKIPPEDRH